MSLRRQKTNDSLDMLLDTMCNTFGGIILLAVLVTLLTSRERTAGLSSNFESDEMLQRRIAIAEKNLIHAHELEKTLKAKAADERHQKTLVVLEQKRKLQAELIALNESVARAENDSETASVYDPAERLRILNKQLRDATANRTVAQNSLTAVLENTRRLQIRLASLEAQAGQIITESERQLRLPKEYETGKSAIYVIAEYGRIYFCRHANGLRNETDISWISDFDRELANPIPNRGLDPSTDVHALRQRISSYSASSVYLVFCVFEDSFPAFIRCKRIAMATGFAYGWEPFRKGDSPVTFSEQGHRPKPQ